MLGASLARAFRNPSVEELFAKGPHLADFSFEVGSPDLEPEIGVGTELFIRVARPRFRAEADLFRNHIAGFIHYVPTTQPDPLYHRFPVFLARAADVAFDGAEGSLQWEAIRRWVVEGTVAYVRATRIDDGDALPSIPPLNGSLGLRYESDGYFLHGMWDATASQSRLPRPFEVASDFDPVNPEVMTPGYNLFGMGAGIRWSVQGALHSVSLQVDNLTDAGYRDHISPLRSVSPQRGRNVQMLYRVQF
jgi:iron complex outermembrane receptor protein